MSNAVKAKSWAKHFRLAYTQTGAPPIIEYATIASGEVIDDGHPVILSSGAVKLAAFNDGALFGVAMAPGVADDVIPVAVGDRNNVFMGQCDDALTGKTYPFECDITDSAGSGEGNFEVDVGSTTEGVLHVIAPVPGDAPLDGDTPPRVFFQIKRSQYDAFVAAK